MPRRRRGWISVTITNPEDGLLGLGLRGFKEKEYEEMKRVLQGLAEEEKERKQRRIDREKRSLDGAMEEREARDNLEERVD